MTSTAARYTFRAIDAEGVVIAQSRGRAGALAKVIGTLHGYRDAVASGSGYLYGNPQTLGTYSVDGYDGIFGPAGWVDSADDVARLDRLGVARMAQIRAEVDAEMAAR